MQLRWCHNAALPGVARQERPYHVASLKSPCLHMYQMTHHHNMGHTAEATCLWLLHTYMWHDHFRYETWPLRMYLPAEGACCVWYDLCIHVTWLLRVCDMTTSYVWHDHFIHICDMTLSDVRHDPFTCARRRCLLCVIWLLHTCDMTPSYMWYDSFICVTWLLCIRYMIPCPYVWHDSPDMWHDSFICVTWLLHMWDMTPAYVPPLTMCLCVMRLLHICDINP